MSARDGLLRHLTGQSLCPPPRPVEEATGLLDAYRAEARVERDAEIIAWLSKKAREYRSTGSKQHASQADAIEVMASKIARGAVRPAGPGKDIPAGDESTQTSDPLAYGPTGYRCGCGKHAHSNLVPCAPDQPEPAPDFFQPGHGYTHRNGTDFLCIAVTAHPNTGEPRALGWIVRYGWHEPGACDPDDWTRNYDGCEPPADEDEWVRCSHLHCPNSERYAKAPGRGWTHHHMDTWRCPQHPLTEAGESRA